MKEPVLVVVACDKCRNLLPKLFEIELWEYTSVLYRECEICHSYELCLPVEIPLNKFFGKILNNLLESFRK
jgi:hypothetical protein